MQIEELEKKDLIRKFKITIPQKDLELAIDKKAEEIASTAKIDGFRPGKVPASFIKAKHKQSLHGDVLDDFMKTASKEVVKQNNFELSSTPRVDKIEFEEKSDLAFEIEMELLPVIPEFDMKKIKLEKNISPVEDKEIEESMDRLRQDHKTFKALPKTAAAKEGDTLLIDAEGSLDGVKFPEGQVTNKQLTLGSKEFIAGFEDGLIGAKAGDQVKLNLKFPKEYWKKELTGKDVVFDVTVKEVSKAELPPIDDALAQKLHLKDLKELKEKIEQSLVKYYDDISINILRKELFDQLDKEIEFQVPEKLIEKELEFLTQDSDSLKESDEKAKDMATRRVKIGLILSDLAKKHKISVSQEEVREEITKHMQSMPGQENLILDYYKNHPEALQGINGKVLEDKSVKFLLQEISLSEKKVTPTELMDLFQAIK